MENTFLLSATKTALIDVKNRPELRIFAFGSARAYLGRHLLTPTDWVYALSRELLFYLLSHSSRTKEQIGLAFWPDASATQLRDRYHAILHHLRRALGDTEWVIFEHGRYIFNHKLPYRFDVQVFEALISQARTQDSSQAIQRLQEATKLYRGDFLEDIFAPWILTRQRELRKKYIEAQLTLGRLFFIGEAYAQAYNVYSQLITYDGFLEIAHRKLMLCYVHLGERSQALRHYQELAATMHKQFGSLPSPETATLYERLRLGAIN